MHNWTQESGVKTVVWCDRNLELLAPTIGNSEILEGKCISKKESK